MQSYKRSFPIYGLLVVLALLLVHCGSDDTTEPTEPTDPLAGAALCLSDSSCTMGAVCDTSAAIAVTNCGNSTVLSWTATDDAAWLNVSVTTGDTPAQFCLIADSNRTGAERTATVTITADDLTDESIDIDVSQPSLGAALFVSLSEWQPSSLGEESEEISVTNVGNNASIDWEVTEDEDWLTLSTTGGSTPGGFTITADAYEGEGSRTGTVTVTASGADNSPTVITVEQFCTIAMVGNLVTQDYARGIFVSGHYAFVADRAGGLQIIDVSVPSSPVLVGSDDTPSNAYAVTVTGDYAYVADDVSGLHIINVSNPTDPAFVATYNTPDRARDVFVSGDYAYVADDDGGLLIINISDPSDPTLAGEYSPLDRTRRVYVQGDYAYVGAYDLWIIDVSDPADPTLVVEYSTPSYAQDVFLAGDHLYVASEGLQIIDVSDPANPTPAGSYSLGSAFNAFVSGDYAFVTDLSANLHIIDIVNASSPALVEIYELPSDAQGLFVSGGYVYVSEEDFGLIILKLGL